MSAELDKQAEATNKLQKGQGNEANALLQTLDKLGSRLYGVKDRSCKGWVDAVKRTNALEAKVYEAASGQKMPAEPADDATKKAVALLDAADKELAGGAELGAQTPRINEARKLLGGTQVRRNDVWVESAARADALVKGIRNAPAPKSPAPPETPATDKPAPASDKPAESAYKLEKGERPPKADKPIKGGDRMTKGVYDELDKSGGDFAAMKPWDYVDERRVQSLKSSLARMEKLIGMLEKIDGGHPDVAWIKGWQAAAVKRVNESVAGAKQAADEHAKAEKAQADKTKTDQTKADTERLANTIYKVEKGERPPKAAEPMNSGARSYYDSDVYSEFDRVAGALAAANADDREVLDRVKDMRNAIARAEKGMLRAPDQSHPDVLWCKGWIGAANEKIAALETSGKKARDARDAAKAAEKKDVDARIDELRHFFDAKTFKTELQPPFTKERVAEWIKNLKQWDQMGPMGLAEVDKLKKEHPKYAKDDRLKSLDHTFRTWLPKAIKDGIAKTVDMAEVSYGLTQGHVLSAIHKVEPYVEVPGARGKPSPVTDDLLKDDVQATRLVQESKAAVEACECRIAYAKEYLGKPDKAYEDLLPKLVALHAQVESSAKGLFENAVMPRSDSDDKNLLEIAKTAFKTAREGYGPEGEWKRMVVNCKQSRETEERNHSWTDKDYIYTKKWTQHYSYFQVCLAEKVGKDWRLVYYDLKNVDDDPGWYVAGRWVKNRIPEANIDK
ncbi:MAG: hypothetical protein ACAI25_09175 [Planctomycetota bacterium]